MEQILEFFIRAKPLDKELLVIDGGSNDKTRDIVIAWSLKYPNIRLLHNPDKFVPFALNMGITSSGGDPVVRLDAHTRYQTDYFERILTAFEKSGADIVGGPMRATGESSLQRAVATSTSTRFGVGNSSFHDENYEGFVDSVYLGAWKRSVFNDTGMFDTKMKRNQDDEFHYRAKSMGKKIYLDPMIRSMYYPRNSLRKLFIQYFQYGLYKPLVLKKVSSEIKWRHLIPALFVLFLMSLPFLFHLISYLALTPLIIYLLIDFIFALRNGNNWKEKLLSVIVYPVLHTSYGIGFLTGLFKKQ